jgi:histidinol-phosphate/aromatic aminotransferase/cobyric acid decarboxylase-like protein
MLCSLLMRKNPRRIDPPEVIVSQYCFAVYPLVARLFNATLVTVPALNYGHNLRAMLKAVTPRTRISLLLILITRPDLCFTRRPLRIRQ